MHRLEECPRILNYGIFRRMFDMSELIKMDDVTRSKILTKMTTERDLRNQMAYARKEAIAEGLAEGRERGLAEGRAEGLAEGLAEGRAEGRAEGLAEAAKRMLAAGMSLAEGAEILKIDIVDLDRMLGKE